jgi:hypothetical protein
MALFLAVPISVNTAEPAVFIVELLFDWYGCRCVDSVHRIFQNAVRHSVVGIATSCGLEGPGIESRWQRSLPHPSKTSWGPPSLQLNGYSAFPGAKAARALRLPPTPF